MYPYEYRISFRVKHPTVDLSYLIELLNLKPKYIGTVGQPRVRPDGVALDGTYKESYLTADLDNGKKICSNVITLDEKIDQLCVLLEPYKDQFEALVQSGGNISFFIGIFIEKNTGIIICPDILQKLAELKIGLELDIYPPDQHQTAE